ncbi:MAG: zf-HC2 domain-containing protein [Dehalococcoidia bacterium]|nr:zf-HC2 domain-containing protein [Dehalococcoidia bacterium]
MFRDKKEAQCRRAKGMLGDFIDGRLGLDEKGEIERHLETCESCRAEFNSLNMTVRLLHDMPAVPVPRSFAVRETQMGKVRAPARREWGWLKPVTAAACIVLLFFIAGDFSGILPGPGDGEAGVLSSSGKTLTGEYTVDGRMENEPPVGGDVESPGASSPGPVTGAREMTDAGGWPLREIQIGLGALVFALVCTMFMVRRRQIRV